MCIDKGYIGIMEKKMEALIPGSTGLGPKASGVMTLGLGVKDEVPEFLSF